jgi:hypothetical protein
MDYQEIRQLMTYPAIDLLRSDNAAMVLGFLYRAFKAQHRAVLPEGQLRAMLESYLEELRQSDPEKYPMTSAQYLGTWCDTAHQYLRKYLLEDSDDPQFELTAGSEKALLWLEQLSGTTGFVGTESRLDSIFKGLDDLLLNTTKDPNVRVKQLEEEAARIREEIDRIRVAGSAPTYSAVQVNERFAQMLTTTRELLSDFRRVEDNFKRIAQEIAEKYAQPGVTKGAIVGHMLDADEALRHSEQGQSFYAFWKLLLSDQRRQQFQVALQQVLSLPDLNDRLKDSPLLRDMIRHLQIEGEKVLDSSQRMATNLRRVLDTTRAADRTKVQELIKEIHTMAVRLRANPPQGDILMVEEYPEIFASMSRPLFEPKTALNELKGVEVANDEMSVADLERLASLPDIQLEPLIRNVEACLEQQPTVTLENVLDRFPPEHGMLQVLGYIMVAIRNPKHWVGQEEEYQVITIAGPTPTRWRVPRILYCK